MADVVLNLVLGRRVGVQHRDFAVPIVEDTALARMPAVGILAIAELDMVHICKFWL